MSNQIEIIARINDKCQPIQRGEIYEQELDAALREAGYGHVSGGGTQLLENGEIAYCEIALVLNDAEVTLLDFVIEQLEALGAPKGSRLLCGDGREDREFGVYEGLAVYLKTENLSSESQGENTLDHVLDEFDRLLGEDGELHSWWKGPSETAIYSYGPEFETLKLRLAPCIENSPACTGARLIKLN